jgi:hypothetical protein
MRTSMAQLTEWLKLMLAEISRKQEETAQGAAEEQARGKAPAASTHKEPPTKTAQVRS